MRVLIPPFLYGTAWKEDGTARLAGLALRAGFRGIDTANQRKHYFEAGVGTALAEASGEGILSRADLFLQTKFTYLEGQDDRLPYDPAARLRDQVRQSMASSLDHLGTDYLDSFVLHGPHSAYEWTADDTEVWDAMRDARDAGHARVLGVSNVGLWHLRQMEALRLELPALVQNRCFARHGWDRNVRKFCRENGIAYQAFSLLTANVPVLRSDLITQIAQRENATSAQVIFSFALGAGMIPLTGTSNQQHMSEDLASPAIHMTDEEAEAIERAGESPR